MRCKFAATIVSFIDRLIVFLDLGIEVKVYRSVYHFKGNSPDPFGRREGRQGHGT
jgi:hypothetical protein